MVEIGLVEPQISLAFGSLVLGQVNVSRKYHCAFEMHLVELNTNSVFFPFFFFKCLRGHQEVETGLVEPQISLVLLFFGFLCVFFYLFLFQKKESSCAY